MASVKESWKKKYSPEEFEKKYSEYKKNVAFSRTLQGYIQKYGEEEGKKRYELKNSHLSVGLKTLKEKGLTDEEIKNIKENHAKNSRIDLEHFIKKYGLSQGEEKYKNWLNKSRERSHRCVEYYVARGFSIEYAREKIKNLQKRDLEHFLLKYGEEEGRKKYSDANKLKSTSLDTYIQKHGLQEGTERFLKNKSKKFSNMEIDFIEKIIMRFGTIDDIYYGKNQYKIGLQKDTWDYYGQKIFYIDFLYKKNKKIIEFNGDLYHANPNKFKSSDNPNPFNKKITAEEIWLKDKKKIDLLNSLGYEVKIVWESEYRENEEKLIQESVDFLRSTAI